MARRTYGKSVPCLENIHVQASRRRREKEPIHSSSSSSSSQAKHVCIAQTNAERTGITTNGHRSSMIGCIRC